MTTGVAPKSASEHETLIREIERQLLEDYAPPRVKRDAHPKMHGCVQAEFIVRNDIDPRFKSGVFEHPGRTYRAWVRFSNAFKIQHDLEFETRGMAIKLLDVVGEPLDDAEVSADDATYTQDFLVATHDAFFLPDTRDYLEFVHATRTLAKGIGKFYLTKLHRRWRGFVAFVRSMTKLAWNPLALTYFSQTPYRLGGEEIIKLQVRPATRQFRLPFFRRLLFRTTVYFANFFFVGVEIVFQRKKESTEDFWNRYLFPGDLLRQALMASLASHDAWFDVLVQPFIDNRATPLDDATRRWKPEFIRVATIRIPRQIFWPEAGMPERFENATKEMVALGENMAFSPWQGLRAHEPLGDINNARRPIYNRISHFRRERNRVSREKTIARQNTLYDQVRPIVQLGEVWSHDG